MTIAEPETNKSPDFRGFCRFEIENLSLKRFGAYDIGFAHRKRQT